MSYGDEKKPDCLRGSFKFRHVTITSRYGKRAELAIIIGVLQKLPSWALSPIMEIFCDSKIGSSYFVEVIDTVNEKEAKMIGDLLGLCFEQSSDRGHNGIYLGDAIFACTHLAIIDPAWLGDSIYCDDGGAF